MYNDLIRQIKLSLHLEKEPVGIRFFLIREEYDEINNVIESKNKKSICTYINEAAVVKIHQKVSAEMVGCSGGMVALGLTAPQNYVKSGKQFFLMRLYESMSVAKKIISQLGFMDIRVYGFEVGPLDSMDNADVVVVLGNAWQMMRMIQAYSFHYAMPQNIGSVGNQGVCADLIARPFQKNDINFSMLCPGARIHMKSSENEMGCGIPIHQFEMVAMRVIKTTSLVMTKQEKEELMERMNSPADLDCEIELEKMYGTYRKNSPYSQELYDKMI